MSKDIIEVMANVKDLDATHADVNHISDRATARLRLLVAELEREYVAEHGKVRGSQSAIAKQLGLDQGMLSAICVSQTRNAGQKYIENARRGCNLKYEYFHGPRTPRSYHDYVGGSMDAPYEAWFDFILTELGRTMSVGERLTLASMRFEDREPSIALYQVFLLDLRGHGDPSKSARRVAINERLDRENKEDDGV